MVRTVDIIGQIILAMRFISIELNNFQAHEHLLVKFGPDLTCIRGATDIGKSSILRALRWVCQNDIAGDEFIKEGAKMTVVKLIVRHEKQNHAIVRVKGNNGSPNQYMLDEKTYQAFGNNVPDDIAKLLNLNEINFQGQHDSPYWFSETAGEVSRRLNAIIDLSVIDTALTSVATSVRQANERKTVSEERLSEAKKEYEELEPQKERVEEFNHLKGLWKTWQGFEDNCSGLESLIGRISTNRDSYRAAKERAEAGEVVLGFALQARRIENRCAELENLITRITDAEANIGNTKQYAEEVEKKFHKRIKGEKCPVCQKLLP